MQRYIEDQIELGEEGLDERDHYLLEVNLEDLESTTGEEQHYWLLQIQAARSERALRESNQNSNKGHNSFLIGNPPASTGAMGLQWPITTREQSWKERAHSLLRSRLQRCSGFTPLS